MQIKKDEIKARILAGAKSDFLKHGFQKASLRNIADKAGLTKGGIYTYFKSKDELFCAIVQPAMNLICNTMKENYGQEYMQIYLSQTDDFAEIYRKEYQKFVCSLKNYRDELKLLFFASSGSRLENFREEIHGLYNKSTLDFCRKLSEKTGNKEVRPSEMLIHTFASLYLRFIEEILLHEPDRRELDEYIEEMTHFMYHGTVNVIRLYMNKE